MSYENRPCAGYKGGVLMPFWIILERLGDVILENVPGCIVEIGIGYSTLVWAKHAEEFKVKLYCCDSSIRKCNWAKSAFTYEGITIINERSSRFMYNFKDEPSIVFIDGDHYAKTVRQEVDFFLPIMKIGGVMFLHDTCPWERTYKKKIASGKIMDTYLVRHELEKRTDVDVFTWRYTAGNCGLTMVLKKDLNDLFYRV